ncbi:MAG: asparagine synthetase B family protein, partial [Polyangiaceae bacterium]
MKPISVLEGKPFGLPPVYWTLRDRRVETAKSPADLGTIDTRVDVDALASLIAETDPLPTQSIFENIHRVPNDSVVTIDASGKSDVQTTQTHIEPLKMTAVEASNELWRLVMQSVERTMLGAKRVAVFTGGGVDSGALLAAAVAVSRGANRSEVGAVALHFGGEGDDRPYMRDLERALGIVAVRINPTDCASGMRSQLDDPRMPMWTPTAPTDFELVRRAAETGADLALSGLGGDDLFDGFPRLLANHFVRHPLDASLRACRLRFSRDVSITRRISSFIVRPLGARIMPRGIRRRRRSAIHLSQWPWAGPRLQAFLEADAAAWRPARVDTPTDRFDYLARGAFLERPLELFDELAHRAGIRLAHPYLEKGLLALMSALPPTLLFHGDRLRGLFRLAARG